MKLIAIYSWFNSQIVSDFSCLLSRENTKKRHKTVDRQMNRQPH